MLGPKHLPVKEKLNIHKVLEHIRQLVNAESKSIRLVADYDPSLPDINADESMLIQVDAWVQAFGLPGSAVDQLLE